MFKHLVLFYPLGIDQHGTDNSELAERFLNEFIETGLVCIPHMVDDYGNRMWELKTYDETEIKELVSKGIITYQEIGRES